MQCAPACRHSVWLSLRCGRPAWRSIVRGMLPRRRAGTSRARRESSATTVSASRQPDARRPSARSVTRRLLRRWAPLSRSCNGGSPMWRALCAGTSVGGAGPTPGGRRPRARGGGGEWGRAPGRRRADVDALRRFAGTGLIEVALGEVELPEGEEEWGVTAALRLARQLEQALVDAAEDEPAWQRAQRRVTDELGTLGDALRRHGNNASAAMQEEGIKVEVVF